MKEEVRQKVMERFSISEQAMRLLLESAEMMSFVPKDIIVHEGEINTNMYILSKGIWRAYTFKEEKNKGIVIYYNSFIAFLASSSHLLLNSLSA